MRRAALHALLLSSLLLLVACSPGRAVEAKRLLFDLSAGGGPSTLKDEAPVPLRRVVSYEVADRRHVADLYQPGETPGAALVLVPGVTPQGRDDPRLVAFATSLARVRFQVLVPEIPNLRSLEVRAEDADKIADALRHMSGNGGTGAPRPVALAAISYAAGPAVIAALQPDLRDRLAFLLLIGGYYDITAVVTFFTTGAYREGPDAPWQAGKPNAYGKWAFVQSNAAVLNTPRDRRLLAEIAARKMRDLKAEIADLVAQLGPQGRAVYALLDNDDPERVPELMAALPAVIADNMQGLDLEARDLSGLDLPVFLLHGADDPVIPYTESRALAEALPEGAARLALVDSLSHVELGPTGIWDALTLWAAAYRLLGQRDAMLELAGTP